MSKLAQWCVRHRWLVVSAWVVLLTAMTVLGAKAGAVYDNKQQVSGTDSVAASRILAEDFPTASGDSDTIVWKTQNAVTDTSVKTTIEPMLAAVAKLPHVQAVQSPYAADGAAQISADGHVAFATVVFDAAADSLPVPAIQTVVDTAQHVKSPALDVELGGDAIAKTQPGANVGISTLVGIIAAAVILLLAFGSLTAMALPLLTAIAGVGVGLQAITFMTHAISVSNFAPTLAILLGLGVGVDYALFIVSRFRRALLAGEAKEQAVITAMRTSGRSVWIAGITVCIALISLVSLGVDFLNGIAFAATAAILLTMAASLTLLPALLSAMGARVLPRRTRRRLAEAGSLPEREARSWKAWSGFVVKHPLPLALAGIAVIAALALPFAKLHLGPVDQGNDPKTSTTRQAYDLLADGFGPGFNGPLLIVAQGGPGTEGNGTTAAIDALPAALAHTAGVAAVEPPRYSADHSAAVIQVFPTTGPEDTATTTLLHHLRDHTIPQTLAATSGGTSVTVHIGGETAVFADYADVLSANLPLFVAIVVSLSFLLLLAMFRSILIPTLTAAMNLLAAGACYGITVAVFQWGWGGSLLGIGKPGPIIPHLPVFLFAILFGLSMDYQVFLVSRIHEAYKSHGDNRRAVAEGMTASGPVITAAAAIMVLVFCSFIFGGDRPIQIFGVGMTTAVLLDALVIRTALVPALFRLTGDATWWLPRWLDKALPHITAEGDDLPETVEDHGTRRAALTVTGE